MGGKGAVLQLILNLLYMSCGEGMKLKKITFGVALLEDPLSSRTPEFPQVEGLGLEV